jgi:hypothetical protein
VVVTHNIERTTTPSTGPEISTDGAGIGGARRSATPEKKRKKKRKEKKRKEKRKEKKTSAEASKVADAYKGTRNHL